MTVYFAQEAGDELGPVKIGYTGDLECRMKALSAQTELGVVLIGRCDGGKQEEAAFHLVLKTDRLKGEWFRYSSAVEAIIAPYRLETAVEYPNRTARRAGVEVTDARGQDAEIAGKLLSKLIDRHPASMGLGSALAEIYRNLSSINDEWTRRRVRALWSKESRRVDFFEIRDLLEANGMDLADLAEWIAPELKEDD